MKNNPPKELPSGPRAHAQGGLPCWCGYQGMGILTDKEPRFARREDEPGLYGGSGRGKR